MDLLPHAFHPTASQSAMLANGAGGAGSAHAAVTGNVRAQASAPRLAVPPRGEASGTSLGLDDALVDEVGAQLDALGVEPHLRDLYYMTLLFMQKVSPHAVRGFVKSMGDALGAAGLSATHAETTGLEDAARSPSLARAEHVLVALDIHVEMMTAEVSARTTADGTTEMSASLSTLRLDIHALITGGRPPAGPPPVAPAEDPLALDLNGNGVIDVARTRRFDLAGRGEARDIPFVSGGDAFVALDRNGNGRIDDGGELFGDQHGAANGFDELARFDGNGDGVIDARDAVYHRLQLLGDVDGDGVDEQRTLADAGVTRIELGYRATSQALGPRATLAQVGRFWQGEQAGLAGALLLTHV